MADSAGVRIDGQTLARPPLGSGEGTGAAGGSDAARAALRRRLLMMLAGLLVVAVGLSGAVEALRVHPIAGRAEPGLITGVDPCPSDRVCAISPQPSAQMWDATFQAFPGYRQVATTVIFDARTGQSYSQSMTLTNGEIVIRLTATREQDSAARAMTVEVASASSDGIVVSARPADGPPDRLAVAALSGPQDALLPVEAAFGWAATVDLFGDGPG